MQIKKTIIYLLEWLLPSSTAVYIIVSQHIGWGVMYFWDYPMNIPAYLIACISGAILYYPINKYVFKNGCDPIEIYINDEPISVEKGDNIQVAFKTISEDKETIKYDFQHIGLLKVVKT